jgi:5-methylcytosine-specific restriction endonuclease McrA
MPNGEFFIDGYPVKRYSHRPKTGYRHLKLVLLEKYGCCYHCGKEVKDYPHLDGVSPPPDMATIDHLKPRQYRQKHEITEKVLSCYECNKRRNDLTQRGADHATP